MITSSTRNDRQTQTGRNEADAEVLGEVDIMDRWTRQRSNSEKRVRDVVTVASLDTGGESAEHG
ncbi:hypothetical protein GN958_ATG08894 [Phytophthora infestans]|uniref:Uncharacterized protein n=1 Tax=Phytophthora infestans TaxID=4787 RepID=A0A8S9US76_PHYIN|nr:hypothetical protein GN958_ATG08894 [Phytophthora infestans]